MTRSVAVWLADIREGILACERLVRAKRRIRVMVDEAIYAVWLDRQLQ